MGARDARLPREVEGRADPQGHARGAARRGEAAARPRQVQLLRARRAPGLPRRDGRRTGEERARPRPRPRRPRGGRPLRHPLDGGRRDERRGPAHRSAPGRPQGHVVLARRARPGVGAADPARARPHPVSRRRVPRGRPAGRRDRRLRSRPQARRARAGRLPAGEGPRDRGPLQLAEAVPRRVGALPPRLPRPPLELPARLAQPHDRRLRAGRGRVPHHLVRDGAAHPDLRPAAGHQHVRDDHLRLVGRCPLRARLRARVSRALLRHDRGGPRHDRPPDRRQRADLRRVDLAARAGAARQHVAHGARAHDHARLRGVHARDGPRPPEPRPLLLRPRQGGAAEVAVAVPLPGPAGGDVLPRGGDDARRGVGVLLVGPLLGLGPEGDVGAHRDPRLPRDPPRTLHRVDQGLRHGRGLAPRLPPRADGVVRRQLRPRHGPALVRLRLGRLLVRRRLRGFRDRGHRRGDDAAPPGAREARRAGRARRRPSRRTEQEMR